MLEFKHVDGNEPVKIKLYTLSTCGWCKKTKAYLSSHGVKYAYVDVDLLSGAEREAARKEQMRLNPSGSFPTIIIDGSDCIVGYNEEQLQNRFGG